MAFGAARDIAVRLKVGFFVAWALALPTAARAEFDHPLPQELPGYYALDTTGQVTRLNSTASDTDLFTDNSYNWMGLEFGPDGRLYGVSRGFGDNAGIYAFTPTASPTISTIVNAATLPDSGGDNTDLAFDGSNLFLVHAGDIYRGVESGGSYTFTRYLDSAQQGNYRSVAVGNDGFLYAARATEIDRYHLVPIGGDPTVDDSTLATDNWATGLPQVPERLVWDPGFTTLYMNEANVSGSSEGIWKVSSAGGSASQHVSLSSYNIYEGMALGPGGNIYVIASGSGGNGILSVDALGNVTTYTANGGTRTALVFTPVPEPAAALLAGFASAVLLLRRTPRRT